MLWLLPNAWLCEILASLQTKKFKYDMHIGQAHQLYCLMTILLLSVLSYRQLHCWILIVSRLEAGMSIVCV